MKKIEVKEGLIVFERRNVNALGESQRHALKICSNESNWGTDFRDKLEQSPRYKGVLVQNVVLMDGEWTAQSIGKWSHTLQSLVLKEDFEELCKVKKQKSDIKRLVENQANIQRKALEERSKALGFEATIYAGLDNVSLRTFTYEDLLEELEESRARLGDKEPKPLADRFPDHVEDMDAYTMTILGLLATHQNSYYITLRCIVKCCGGNRTQAMTALTNLVGSDKVCSNDFFGKGSLLGYEFRI